VPATVPAALAATSLNAPRFAPLAALTQTSARATRLDFAAYHNRPSAPTNLTLHQAIELDVPIGCGDVAVFPGDIVVGDGEGVVVIPAHLADDIAAEAVEMTVFEDFVLGEVQAGASIVGLYPPTDPATLARYARWRADRSSAQAV